MNYETMALKWLLPDKGGVSYLRDSSADSDSDLGDAYKLHLQGRQVNLQKVISCVINYHTLKRGHRCVSQVCRRSGGLGNLPRIGTVICLMRLAPQPKPV